MDRNRTGRLRAVARIGVVALALAVAGAPLAGFAGTLKGVVNVNTASVDELTLLPGVGDSRAAAIVALRKQRGALKKPEDLLAVKGIGDKSLAKLRPFLAFQGRTTLAASD